MFSAGSRYAATAYRTASHNPYAQSLFASYKPRTYYNTTSLNYNFTYTPSNRGGFNLAETYKSIKKYAKSGYHKIVNTITGGAKALVANARKFLGYNEKDGSYKLFTGGRTEAWCADFVSYIARQTGVKGFNFPSVSGILNWGKANGRFSKQAKVGDAIIFKGWDPKRKKYASHTGIVTRVENGRVYTIEGNTSNKVAERSYALNDSKITGYVSIA